MSLNVDWRELITRALPSFLRQPLIIALLMAATAPIRSLYDRFVEMRDEDRYRLEHNGQVCHLLGLLEDRYPSTQGIRYRIEDVLPSGRVVDTFSAKRPAVPIASPNASEKVLDTIREGYTADRSSFRVYVPRDVYNKHLREVIYLVDQYKLLTRSAIFLPTDR